MVIHYKCRNSNYPGSIVARATVPDNLVQWNCVFPQYSPVQYTAPSVLAKPVWADPDLEGLSSHSVKWNSIDGKVNRKSHNGGYEIASGVPRNPVGRTGICGRGLLGKWGPNHAADPIVTRWKRTGSNAIQTHSQSGLPILEFVAIQRSDCRQWAIPGGMIDVNERVSFTLKREFSEEALNSLDLSPAAKKEMEKSLGNLFSGGTEVYRGYVDDPRNTDNSWMETIAVNFHDDTGLTVGQFKLNAGSDASRVQWHDMHGNLDLYANHKHFLKKVAEQHKAHW